MKYLLLILLISCTQSPTQEDFNEFIKRVEFQDATCFITRSGSSLSCIKRDVPKFKGKLAGEAYFKTNISGEWTPYKETK